MITVDARKVYSSAPCNTAYKFSDTLITKSHSQTPSQLTFVMDLVGVLVCVCVSEWNGASCKIIITIVAHVVPFI